MSVDVNHSFQRRNDHVREESHPTESPEGKVGHRHTDAEGAATAKEAPVSEAPSPSEAPAKTKAPKPKAEPKPKKVSALDAAAKVLGENGKPMNCLEMIEEMSRKNYWSSPNGATPQGTLYAAILREIKVKGDASRFAKTERGKFAATR